MKSYKMTQCVTEQVLHNVSYGVNYKLFFLKARSKSIASREICIVDPDA